MPFCPGEMLPSQATFSLHSRAFVRHDRLQPTTSSVWHGVLDARSGSPNDEAVSLYPLYKNGLSEILWAGVVQESSTVALNRKYWSSKVVVAGGGLTDRTMPTHYVIPTKECLIEVLADRVEVHRIDGDTATAVRAAITR
jgi:hypothetical protein